MFPPYTIKTRPQLFLHHPACHTTHPLLAIALAPWQVDTTGGHEFSDVREVKRELTRLHRSLIDEEDEEALLFLFRETKRLKKVRAYLRRVRVCVPTVCGCVPVCMWLRVCVPRSIDSLIEIVGDTALSTPLSTLISVCIRWRE